MKNDDEEKQYPTQAQDTQKKNLRTKQLNTIFCPNFFYVKGVFVF